MHSNITIVRVIKIFKNLFVSVASYVLPVLHAHPAGLNSSKAWVDELGSAKAGRQQDENQKGPHSTQVSLEVKLPNQ